MDPVTTRPSVELQQAGDHSNLALVLALLSVPGSFLTWDTLPGGGYVWGYPPAIAAVVLGVVQLRRSRLGRRRAVAAIVIASAMLLMMTVWGLVETVAGT